MNVIKTTHRKKVIGTDNKERILLFMEDGNVRYYNLKNGQQFGTTYFLKDRKPKWMSKEDWKNVKEESK